MRSGHPAGLLSLPLSFTPDDMPGWHQLTVRVARKDARVRTRAGFWMSVPESSLR